jgi:hypothetical protein
LEQRQLHCAWRRHQRRRWHGDSSASIKPGVGEYRWLNEGPIADAPYWLVEKAKQRQADAKNKPKDDRHAGDDNEVEDEDDLDGGDRELEAGAERIAAALEEIPNDNVSWSDWNRIAMATFRATNGSGFDAFDKWSSKSSKYDSNNTRHKWDALRGCPPIMIGAGTIFYLANEAKRAKSLKPNHDTSAKQQSKPAAVLSKLNDLLTKKFEPIKFIVPGYIVDGSCTLLAGRPKIGKSWWVLDVGIAVWRAGYCLGDIQCEGGDVLYLALEDNERRLQSRTKKVIGNTVIKTPYTFHYQTDWPRAEQGGLYQIRDWIAKANNPRLVIIDVLARFRSPPLRNQQPYEADYAAIQGLQAISSQTGVAIVIVHHLRKTNGEFDPFEKVSGTLGLSGAADTVLVLDRDSNGVTLYGRGRDIEEIESAMQFNKKSCRWRVLGDAGEVRRSDERSAILTFLIGEKEPVSNKDIAAATGMPQNNIDQLLFKMVREGEVLKVGRGRYIHPSKDASIYPPHKEDKEIRKEGDGAEVGVDLNAAPPQRSVFD